MTLIFLFHMNKTFIGLTSATEISKTYSPNAAPLSAAKRFAYGVSISLPVTLKSMLARSNYVATSATLKGNTNEGRFFFSCTNKNRISCHGW